MRQINESFNTKYTTYVIAYCVDTNEWFITNERHWFFQFDEEFESYDEAHKWFADNITKIAEKQSEILINCGQKPDKLVIFVE